MNIQKFLSPEEISLIMENIKAGTMTTADVRLAVKNSLNNVYNTILSVDMENITRKSKIVGAFARNIFSILYL